MWNSDFKPVTVGGVADGVSGPVRGTRDSEAPRMEAHIRNVEIAAAKERCRTSVRVSGVQYTRIKMISLERDTIVIVVSIDGQHGGKCRCPRLQNRELDSSKTEASAKHQWVLLLALITFMRLAYLEDEEITQERRLQMVLV